MRETWVWSPVEGNGYSLIFWPEEFTAHRVAKSWTRLNDFHFHFFLSLWSLKEPGIQTPIRWLLWGTSLPSSLSAGSLIKVSSLLQHLSLSDSLAYCVESRASLDSVTWHWDYYIYYLQFLTSLYLSARFFNVIISNIHSWPCKDTQKPELLEGDQGHPVIRGRE